jgi:hypothetical protein
MIGRKQERKGIEVIQTLDEWFSFTSETYSSFMVAECF